MANSIAYAKAYKNMLDKIYKLGSVTAILEAGEGTYKFNPENAKEILLQKLSVNGLGTYNRATGYVSGDATVTWETHTFGQDRGRKYNLDVMDEKEAMLSISRLMAEIMRTKLVPEIDAYRFGKIVSLCGVDATANLTYDDAVSALDTGIETLSDAEVPQEGRVCFISNEMHTLLKQSGEFYNARISTTKNDVLNRKITMIDDMPLITVPASRFYSAFDLYDGSTSGQEAGGFVASSGATKLNFMIVHSSSAFGVIRHMNPKLIAPQFNADTDGWVFAPRMYHELFCADNKLSGVYVHKKTS